MKKSFTKQQLLDYITTAKDDKYLGEILFFIEDKYLSIRDKKLQTIKSKIKNLYHFDEPTQFTNVWGGLASMSKHCIACMRHRTLYIKSSSFCNLNCNYCFHYKGALPLPPTLNNLNYIMIGSGKPSTLREIEVTIIRHREKINSVAWSHQEPLMQFDKLLDGIKAINNFGLYQCLYTNGVLITEDKLRKLRDAGLNEIRFNAQATDFSKKVLSNIQLASEIIDMVIIETPMFSRTFANLMIHKKFIKKYVNQINCPELGLNQNNYHLFKEEGPLYRSHKGLVSPISARFFTYSLITLAEEEQWDMIINDCSNDTKFYRDIDKDNVVIHNHQHCSGFTLPKESYEGLIGEIYQDEQEIEIFRRG